MNKRLLAGIAAAGIIGGGVYGFAATLGVTSDTVSAGNIGVNSCDDTVQVDYTVSWDTTQYEIDDVTVSGINDTACDGDAISVTLLGSGSPVTLTAGTVDDVTETFDASGSNVSANLVNNVHVAIGG